MIHKSTFDFLENLAQNNQKTWFDANRTAYEAARKNIIAFAEAVIGGISAFDADIANAQLEPKSCISRINRDVRFSNDKSPYKTNFFMIITAGGKKSNKAGYYLEIKPNNCFVGGGAYMPMPEDLQKFRQEIDYNFEEWKKMVEDSNFLRVFPEGVQAPEKLSRPPKGFEAENPAVEYLKMKGFYTWRPVSDEDMMSEKGFATLMEGCRESQKMIAFLNRAL
ncbi:MAG: DUF2461 domain-containing protein [Spirosomaceae bacterium]|nr:DUF2461 domain-containing protein [Spirosomataceae bacterium]